MPLRTLFELLWLRANPQDLPPSRALLAQALAAAVVVDALVLLAEMPLARGLLAGVLDVALLAAFVRVALELRGFGARFAQTLAALAFVGAALSLAAHAAVQLLLPNQQAAALAWLAVLAWYLAVSGHVLRHALEIPWLAASGVSLLYVVSFWSLMQFVFGNPVSPAE